MEVAEPEGAPGAAKVVRLEASATKEALVVAMAEA